MNTNEVNNIRKLKHGVFFYISEDGTPSDAGLVDDMLADEDRIRQELIDAGVIREIVVENIKTNKA